MTNPLLTHLATQVAEQMDLAGITVDDHGTLRTGTGLPLLHLDPDLQRPGSRELGLSLALLTGALLVQAGDQR